MDFSIPDDIREKLRELDAFIEAEIEPLERANPQFLDHRREYARTNWEGGGVPSEAWEALLAEVRRRADAAGHLRYGLPRALGGQDASNLAMAIVREHLAARGLGLHSDLQSESSIVGNFPLVHMMFAFGTDAQKERYLEGMITGEHRIAFGLTEPAHGSDATYLETTAVRDGDAWVLNGAKRFNTGLHTATVDLVFARTSGSPGQARGITAFLVPTDAPGFSVDYMWWTLNMPSDHAEATLRDVRVPHDAILHREGEGMTLAQHFVHENRIRQAASGVGAAQYCIDEAVAYARKRHTWGRPLAINQAIQFPLAELHTETEMVRYLVYKTAWHLDQRDHLEVSDRVSMANYRANRLVCQAADLAMQVHGGVGYSRHKPFEHIYRHHRRYRITEGSEEIQIRKVAGHLFGFVRGG
jgi:acyl-CoA dehydrogenase